jgi:hypothetical protein
LKAEVDSMAEADLIDFQLCATTNFHKSLAHSLSMEGASFVPSGRSEQLKPAPIHTIQYVDTYQYTVKINSIHR